MELKVISFNIRCCDDKNGNSIAERGPRLGGIINSYSPDVIGIQEFRPAWQEQFDKYFLDEYDIYNVPRDSLPNGESVPVLWKKDRFDCVKKATFWLSDTPEVESGDWDEKYHKNRICSYVILRDKRDGKTFAFMNTHFGFGDMGQTKSAELIYKYSNAIGEDAVFVTGDFNMNPKDLGYAEMIKHFTDVNAVTANEKGITFHGYAPEKYTDTHIDFCFINGGVKPLSYKIIKDTVDGKYPSDHYGLLVGLEV